MPTTTGFTHLFAFFPPWALEGNIRMILKRLTDAETRVKMRKSIENGKQIWPHEGDNWSLNLFKIMGWECARIMSVTTEKNKHLEGMTLCAVARERKMHPFEAACQLLIEEDGHILVFESMGIPDDNFTERSTFAGIKHPLVSISTDTILLGFGQPSFLFYGCYPKFLGRYVREKNMLSLPLAVRKITSLPAEHFGLKNRGMIKKGYYADIVVFDPDTIENRGQFHCPDMDPVGIHYVAVNGTLVVDGGNFIKPDKLPGRVIRRETPA
jgi:N-acyl-D-amino-acid deacylase